MAKGSDQGTRRSAQAAPSLMKQIVNYRQFGLIIALIILLIVAAFIAPTMYKPASLISMLRNNSIFAILSVAVMLVILTGGIDLSIASTLAMTGVITSMLMNAYNSVPAVVWVLVGLLVGGVCGLVNGFLVGKLNMMPLIATLGTMYMYRGLAFLVSGGIWLFPNKFTTDYSNMAQGTFLGLNNIIWVAIVIFIAAALFLGYTRPGRRIYAVGTNLESSEVAGIKVGNVLILAYTLCGALSGLAGVLYTANYSLSYYGIADGFEMQAIAICILGGVSIVGGVGRIDGVIIGVVLMSVISYFITFLQGLSVWQSAIQGAIILVAVAINIFTGRLANRRALKEREALI